MTNFPPKTIAIRSIFKKAFFAQFKELGYPVKYHDDSSSKDHFEESDWVIAAFIYFGADVIRDLLKDRAKKGLNFLIDITIETCKKAFFKKIYKVSGKEKELKEPQIEIGIQGYDKRIIINRNDDYHKELFIYLNEYRNWLDSQDG